MKTELFTLTAEPEDYSLSMKVPIGWTWQRREGLGGAFKVAIDPDGCVWYPVDETWKLNVPYFTSSADHRACVSIADGTTREYPITDGGTILIGKRRIRPGKWIH